MGKRWHKGCMERRWRETSPWGQPSWGTGCPERLRSLQPRRLSRPDMKKPWTTTSKPRADSAFTRRVGQETSWDPFQPKLRTLAETLPGKPFTSINQIFLNKMHDKAFQNLAFGILFVINFCTQHVPEQYFHTLTRTHLLHAKNPTRLPSPYLSRKAVCFFHLYVIEGES